MHIDRNISTEGLVCFRFLIVNIFYLNVSNVCLFRCVEVLIAVQVKNTRDRLSDIDALHKAQDSFENRLDNLEKEVNV